MTRPMRHRRVTTSIVALCALALVPSAPLKAAADEKADEPSKSEKLVTQVTALTAAIEGLRAKPADTVATGGGQLEGALLSSFAIKAAAGKIRDDITSWEEKRSKPDAKGTKAASNDTPTDNEAKFLVASPADAASTDRWMLFEAQIKGLCFRLTTYDACKKPMAGGSDLVGGPLAVATAVLPFLSSILRSETEVSALGGELSDSRLLALALADGGTEVGGSRFELLAPPRPTNLAESEPYRALQDLIAARNKASAANTKKKKPDAAIAASVKAADEFVATTLSADAAGKVPLVDIVRAKMMLDELEDASLITVTIEKAGGTMLKRKGIDVSLGAPSVRASGGVIISYTVVRMGKVEKTGFLACTTRLTELKRIHKLNSGDFKGKCS